MLAASVICNVLLRPWGYLKCLGHCHRFLFPVNYDISSASITTKMHAALAIPEVVGHIVNQMEPTILCSFHPNPSPYNLLAVAMISKSFSIHAVNQLWSNIQYSVKF
jgi:hypothetical protein